MIARYSSPRYFESNEVFPEGGIVLNSKIHRRFLFGKTVLVSVLLLLVACTQSLSPGQTVVDVKKCKAVCQHRWQICQQTCRNNSVQCGVFSSKQTLNRYCRYQHEQRIKGERCIRQLNSYRDPLQCVKITCHCADDLKVCKQSCLGKIDVQLSHD